MTVASHERSPSEIRNALQSHAVVKLVCFHTALYGHRPVCQADFDVMSQRGTGCSLISGLCRAGQSLLALMESAKNVLISTTCSSAHGCVQVCALAVRPVLPSHANQPAQPIGSSVHRYPAQDLVGYPWLRPDVVLLVGLTVRQNRPRRSYHLVSHGHRCHVGGSSRLNVLLPRRGLLSVVHHRSRAMDQQRAQIGIASL